MTGAVAAEVRVEMGERSYPIRITTGGLEDLGAAVVGLCPGGRLGVVTDDRVEGLYRREAEASLERMGLSSVWSVIPEGEESKTLHVAEGVVEQFLDARLDRKTPILALGGGVVGDLAGFVASMVLRGIPFIQVPTTLLAQVDSSVGGKTGVNSRHGKNLIGAFYQPGAVFAAMGTLSTLEDRDLRAGLAEVVKYGVIADAELFGWLEENAAALLARDFKALLHIVRRSCQIKAEIVARDERESGPRALLNFGHTAGHGIEAVTGYGTWRHGEAVSMGMVLAARLSVGWGCTTWAEADRLESLLNRLGLPVNMPEVPRAAFLDSLLGDKKVAGRTLKFVEMDGIGRASLRPVPVDALRELFDTSAAAGHLTWA